MKSETKELVEWIKSQVMLASKLDESYKITPSAIDTHRDLESKALSFLDSLPEIESHLCRGGYIQDKNGTPCCEGDLIKATATADGYEVQGVLTWENYCFCLYDKKGCCNHILCPTYIYEKVEE